MPRQSQCLLRFGAAAASRRARRTCRRGGGRGRRLAHAGVGRVGRGVIAGAHGRAADRAIPCAIHACGRGAAPGAERVGHAGRARRLGGAQRGAVGADEVRVGRLVAAALAERVPGAEEVVREALTGVVAPRAARRDQAAVARRGAGAVGRQAARRRAGRQVGARPAVDAHTPPRPCSARQEHQPRAGDAPSREHRPAWRNRAGHSASGAHLGTSRSRWRCTSCSWRGRCTCPCTSGSPPCRGRSRC